MADIRLVTERETLRKAFQRWTDDGTKTVAMIEAETGHGKSMIVDELCAFVTGRGLQIW
jgi:Cdc6-like AAA superfamily ATPase